MFISSFFLFFIILFTSQDIICHLEHSFCFPSCSIFTDIHLFIYLRLIINCINKQIILNLSSQKHQNALEHSFFLIILFTYIPTNLLKLSIFIRNIPQSILLSLSLSFSTILFAQKFNIYMNYIFTYLTINLYTLSHNRTTCLY